MYVYSYIRLLHTQRSTSSLQAMAKFNICLASKRNLAKALCDLERQMTTSDVITQHDIVTL